jgi:LacI family transcriptional regulator, gluconate utilization system Gnt-I transcriptional repressor
MNDKPRNANLADVAARAGVSMMTVSRTLRQPDAVSPATRRRVHDAIKKLGYLPNNIAGGLRTKRSRTIACVIPTIASPVFAHVVQGLTDVLHRHDYRLVLGTSNYSSAEELDVVNGLLAHRPDAIILTAGDRRPELDRRIRHLQLPVVELWEMVKNPLDMNVGFSNQDAAAALVRHMIAEGARRIAFVGVTTTEHARARARRRGYETVVRNELDQPPIVANDQQSIDGGRRALLSLLTNDPAIDGIFCVGDIQAVGALLEAQNQGWDVPRRLMIAGFGDSEFGRHVGAGLTTVRIPEYRIGHAAGEMIVARLTGEQPAQTTLNLGFEIVARGSTARRGAQSNRKGEP